MIAVRGCAYLVTAFAVLFVWPAVWALTLVAAATGGVAAALRTSTADLLSEIERWQ